MRLDDGDADNIRIAALQRCVRKSSRAVRRQGSVTTRRSSVYHFAGYPSYGNTKRGAYMCEVDATRQGMHAAKAEQHPLAAVKATFLSNDLTARSSDTAFKVGLLSHRKRTPRRTSRQVAVGPMLSKKSAPL